MNKIEYLQKWYELGYKIFPCVKNLKIPATKHGLKDATNSREEIYANYEKHPDSNWAVRTGSIKSGGSGFFVLDIDKKYNGDSSLEDLTKNNGPLPLTYMVKTPSGGLHYYFQQPDGIELRNSAGKLADGIDIRANDGYVLIPPSEIDGNKYEVISDLPIAPAPDWLLEKLLNVENKEQRPNQKLLSFDVISEGTRNDTIFREACALRNRGYEYEEILASIQAINENRCEVRLDQEELEDIAQSAMRYEPTHAIAESPKYTHTLTDVGNAERFVRQYGETVRYCEQMKSWFIWNGKFWEKDNNNKIRKFAHSTAKSIYSEAAQCKDEESAKKLGNWAKISLSTQRLDGMLKEARSYVAISVPEFDINQELLNVRNGVINISTGQLEGHKKEYMITRYIDIEFDKEATCPKWDEFLDMIFNGNPALINFIQKLSGLSITGVTDEQIIIFLYGLGANGKSTFVNTLHKILGSYGTAINIEALLHKNYVGGTTPYLVNLLNKRFVTATEIPGGKRLNESLIKELSGQDGVSVNPKYEKAYSFHPTHKLWIVGNHKPQVRDDSYGFWRRLKVIPFEVKIPEEKQKPMSVVLNEFMQEAPGILNWAIEGYQKWLNEGLDEPLPVKAATQEYRSEQDLLQQFLDEECDLNPYNKILKKKLLEEFNKWLFSQGEGKYTTNRLSRQLIVSGIKVGGDGKKYYLGIDLLAYEDTSYDLNGSVNQLYGNNETISMSPEIKKMVESQIDTTFNN